ncbi:unnamed protein product [Parascedosporium putredinis]|uniref:Stress-response A/B barrel domain-containing protein n=1 Tax=Parascedosporium putredinis TaxID=1442378 RepID=A0A9P1H9H3_9PEZI|nr:unnamed protein product [Parascedosporium putredinis]CAI8001902.1 unnamed protein product [Parascedosporium putredinis]
MELRRGVFTCTFPGRASGGVYFVGMLPAWPAIELQVVIGSAMKGSLVMRSFRSTRTSVSSATHLLKTRYLEPRSQPFPSHHHLNSSVAIAAHNGPQVDGPRRLLALAGLLLYGTGLLPGLGSFLIPDAALVAPGVTHIVLFQFKSSLEKSTIDKVYRRMLALKSECLHPVRSRPYIKSIQGGSDNSPEGLQNGITHAFVVEFASTWDRDYYVNDDPAHKAFVQWVGSAVEKATVVDFVPGRLE